MKKAVIIIIIVLTILIFGLIYYFKENNTNLDNQIKKTNLNKIDNLMIVAHPDDETIWGGFHLIDSNYLVVCITGGRNIVRTKELKSVMKVSKNKVISLGYPEKILGKKDDWSTSYDGISKDLTRIMKLKKWKVIATHNPKGEYGHIHHKMTNKIVTDIYIKEKIEGDLYFFGDYYTKNKISSKIDSTYIPTKRSIRIKNNKMIKKYKSQRFINDMFGHMFKYEDWNKFRNDEVEKNE